MADQGTNVHNKNDFIRREAAISEIMSEPTDAHYPSWYAEKLKQVFAADVRPVVKAHWIYHEDDYGDYYECSHCHDEYVVYEGDMCWRYCPTCGAEMEPNLDTTKGERRDESNG